MREVFGADLFAYPADAIVIPTNGQWRYTGEMTRGHTTRSGTVSPPQRIARAVMGIGVALEAKRRYPLLDRFLADQLAREGNHTRWWHSGMWTPAYVVCFPTKDHWRDPSDLTLIERSARELATLADKGPGAFQPSWQTVALPRVGCGLGGLDWESQVRPLLAGILDDRFVVVTPDTDPRPAPGDDDTGGRGEHG